jgi:chromosomal replication initiator protein
MVTGTHSKHTTTAHVSTSNHNSTELTRRLVEQLGERPVTMWFRDTELHVEDGRLQVHAETRFAADWIRRRFNDELRTLAGTVIAPDAEVDILVTPSENTEDAPIAPEAPAAPDRQRGSRAPAAFRPDARFHELEGFVVGDSNQLAWTAATRLASDGERSPVSPLFIHGGCGLGKTHLLQGLCRKARDLEGPAAKVRYVTGERFTNEYITAIREGTIDRFRSKHRDLTLLAIDDVQFFKNKKKTQSEFLHTLDAIELTGARLALASNEHPTSIATFSRNLTSRFLSGMVVQLERPDLDTRLRMIHRLAEDRSVRLSDGAARLLASKCLDSMRELQGAVTRLAAMQMIDPQCPASDDPCQLFMPGFNDARDRLIGQAAVQRVFASTQWAPETPVPVSAVVEVVAQRTGVTRAELAGSSRHQRISLARGLVAYLARSMTTASYPEIAEAMGRSNHSSVHASVRRISKKLDHEPTALISTPDGDVERVDLSELLEELQRTIRQDRRGGRRGPV